MSGVGLVCTGCPFASVVGGTEGVSIVAPSSREKLPNFITTTSCNIIWQTIRGRWDFRRHLHNRAAGGMGLIPICLDYCLPDQHQAKEWVNHSAVKPVPVNVAVLFGSMVWNVGSTSTKRKHALRLTCAPSLIAYPDKENRSAGMDMAVIPDGINDAHDGPEIGTADDGSPTIDVVITTPWSSGNLAAFPTSEDTSSIVYITSTTFSGAIFIVASNSGEITPPCGIFWPAIYTSTEGGTTTSGGFTNWL